MADGIESGADQRLRQGGWVLIAKSGAIRLYNRQIAESTIPAALVWTVIPVSPKRLYDVITDYDHFADFVPYVASSRVLAREEGARVVYQHLRFPGPIADRSYVIISRDNNRPREEFFRVEWALAPPGTQTTVPVQDVIPVRFSGYWELLPLAKGAATQAVYSVHFEPGGAIPSWLTAFAMNNYLPKVVNAVIERAKLAGDDTDGHLESGAPNPR